MITKTKYSVTVQAEAKGWRVERSMEIAGGGSAPGHITLCWTGSEYATHFFNTDDGGFHIGHYYASLDPAMVDFIARVRRGY